MVRALVRIFALLIALAITAAIGYGLGALVRLVQTGPAGKRRSSLSAPPAQVTRVAAAVPPATMRSGR